MIHHTSDNYDKSQFIDFGIEPKYAEDTINIVRNADDEAIEDAELINQHNCINHTRFAEYNNHKQDVLSIVCYR